MNAPRSAIERAIIHLFFQKHKNTNEIAKIVDVHEPGVDRVVARELARQWKEARC